MGNKILLIDDNEKGRMLVRDILQLRGFEVIEAGDGEEGINKAKELRPDLVLMDIQMPVMDGFAAIRLLRNDPDTKDIKVVAVTSFAMSGDKQRIIDSGFNEYVSKPIDTRQLPELVKKLLA